MKEASDEERCLDPQLWHACAGAMVHNCTCCRFSPAGPAEHADGGGAVTELAAAAGPHALPAFVLCSVAGVRFLADPETGEVFARIRPVPLHPGEPEDLGPFMQSDVNNAGGFPMPRYCAVTIFPKLDSRAEPPVQLLLTKDVHGEVWRSSAPPHQPWNAAAEKLVAGDSIVFQRTEYGGTNRWLAVPWWAFLDGPCHGGFSAFLKDEDNKMINSGSGISICRYALHVWYRLLYSSFLSTDKTTIKVRTSGDCPFSWGITEGLP